MKILHVTFSDMTSELLLPGLENLGEHSVEVLRYDRVGVPVDGPILSAVENEKPDLVCYFGMAGGPYLAKPETWREVRKSCRTVMVAGDLSDPDWLPFLEGYSRAESFDCTVNIDGNDNWPAGEHDLTLLTPADPHFYHPVPPLTDRPIPFGFAGGFSSPSRARIINRLIEGAGLKIKVREEQHGTYQRYADFLMSTRIVPNVPFSGSDRSVQVKGRVIESGLAGCVLLENSASPAKRWFASGDDFIVYDDADDAIDKVKFLLNNPGTMLILAENLSKKVRANHSPKKFWDQVFAKAMR